MIIFRYLARQIFQIMSAITLILLVVVMISRFLGYLGQAVAGEISSDILLRLMLFRLPEFLLVIVPFALFLSILLAFGRMYSENEMTVLSACGYSQKRLATSTVLAASLLSVLMGVLSLQIAPLGLQNAEQLLESQDELTELDLIVAGQFQRFDEGLRTTYAESISTTEAGRLLRNTFVAWRQGSEGQGELRIILADSARPVIDERSGRRFMLLENGVLYEGSPGEADYLVTQFDEQALLMPEPERITELVLEKSLPTQALLASSEPAYRAELQWRLSVILLIPILTLIAVPLSKVSPRKGRFSRLLPATLLYALYYVTLQMAMTLVEDETVPATVGLWWVHGLFLALGLYLLLVPGLKRPPRRMRGAAA
ncbi:MAG: LPS export ABC transporter permease LptF [Pseudomonadales bacterium]|nr:LPS export ABC transporter permease LptF [Pseudomonadales bacterium]MCP5329990.1 LPS export ABC transporter permease LptF [Pseudomonadales bacterium]MCP5343102.1 LPS export ABC transporter permease LptF [Pseudomonadales bacterium]